MNILIMPENPFFKLDMDRLCLICNCKFEEDQTTHSILDKLEQTQSQMNVYDALESISNFKEINFQLQAKKVCEFCYKNISTVSRFCEMCNKSASFLQSYIQYQEINNISPSVITNPETYLDRPMSTVLTCTNILSTEPEVLNDHEALDVQMQVCPELPTIATCDTLNSTAEAPMFEKEERQITNLETYLEELCSNENMLYDEEEQDVKLEVWPELSTIISSDTLSSTAETTMVEKDEAKIKEMRQALKTATSLINNDKEIGKENHEKIIENRARRVKCKICDRFFRRDYVLIHMRMHTDERPLSCELCGKKFMNPSAKSRHKQTHTAQNECKVCGKKFNRTINLKEHLIVHSDERPFPCEKCGKCFPSKNYLGRHMIKHVEEKRHECKVCGKKFKRALNLKEHLIVHSDERPFVCEKCGKCFPSKKHLRQHMICHLEKKKEKRHECQLCGNRFTLAPSLRRHLSTSCKGKKR